MKPETKRAVTLPLSDKLIVCIIEVPCSNREIKNREYFSDEKIAKKKCTRENAAVSMRANTVRHFILAH